VTQPSRPRSSGAAAAVVALCLMLVTLVACSDDEKAAPTTTAPDGFTVMSDAKEGFALAVPADWTMIPLSNDPEEFNRNANALRLENPKLASILNQARILGQSGGKFMAVTRDGVGSVNLTVDKPKEKSLQEVVRNSIAALTQFGATNVAEEAATVDGRPAVRLTFRLPVETDDGVKPTDEVQHYVLEDGKAYILSVLGAPPEVASAVASSFRIR
jgi:hypothetical protein